MIDPISAVAINPSSMNQSTASNLSDSSSLSTSWSSGPDVLTIRATDMTPGQFSNPLTSQSFENLSRVVHTGLKEFKINDTRTPMQLDNEIVAEQIDSLAPKFDNTGHTQPVLEKTDTIQDSYTMLQKTFQHATFSAMVTQVASGVSNSVRMLARQS